MDDNTIQELCRDELLSPDDFDDEEMELRNELDEGLRAAVSTYSDAPYGSIDCVIFRLRELHLKITLSQLDWRVCTKKYSDIDRDDPTWTKLENHYTAEQNLFISERMRLGRELWHLFQKAEHKAASEAAYRTKTQKNKAKDLFVLLMREITVEEKRMFLEAMENVYSLEGTPSEIWSPVTGRTRKADLSAVHIFPPQVGQDNLGMVFGDGFDVSIHGAENGLFLPPAVKHAFQDYQVTIIPDPVAARPHNYKFVVLDPKILRLKVNGEMTFNDLNGRTLVFKPGCDLRPSPQFIRFHCAVAVRMAMQKCGLSNEMPNGVFSELGGAWKDPTTLIEEDLLVGFIEAFETYREVREKNLAARQVVANNIVVPKKRSIGE
ncbi:hypothetical protein BDDG_03479 [Blastomyces dermatitidis ATCC 18188]|uniref:HNH nuclease domain-containing protein n=1 Tax=Ajellomyces dermatitidis (strain ATCC 18188 / CBS 674.68) TaxID=653446 RepID=F2TBF1_AJEDA|nr:hypothetical protein BDDG_03479 [Blastomyces dermatitidis ATCC 18188]